MCFFYCFELGWQSDSYGPESYFDTTVMQSNDSVKISGTLHINSNFKKPNKSQILCLLRLYR